MNGNEIIIKDVEFKRAGKNVKNAGKIIDKSLHEYKKSLVRISQDSIVSGDVHDALVLFISYIRQLLDVTYDVSKSFYTNCNKFIDEIDCADQYLYEIGGSAPRVFTNDEQEKLIDMIDDPICGITDGLGDFFGGIGEKIGLFDVTKSKKDLDYCHKHLLDLNDASEKTIRDIFDEVRAINRKYGESISGDAISGDYYTCRFSNICLSLISEKDIICKMSEIISPKNSKFTVENIDLALSSLFTELNGYVCDTLKVSEPGEDVTIDEIKDFASDYKNETFYLYYNAPFSEEISEIGGLDALKMVVFQGSDVTLTSLSNQFSVPEDVENEDIYAYLLVKKHLSETIAEMADNDIDITEESESYLKAKKIIDIIQKGKKKFPEYKKYKDFYDTVFKCAETISDSIGYGVDISEIVVAMFADYLESEKIIESLAGNVEKSSLLGIAVRELQYEYQHQFIASLNKFKDYVLSEAVSEVLKQGKKAFLSLAGKGATGLYSVVDLGIKTVGELSGMSESSSALLEFMCVYNTNGDLQDAYRANFQKVASGDCTETDVINLKNSFELIKKNYIKEYELLAKYAGGEGRRDKKAYYEFLARKMSKLYIDSPKEDFAFVSYDEYLSY